MKLFIDGIIFGRQRFGGISKVWEETLHRLPHYDVEISLLIPFIKGNASLRSILKRAKRLRISQDFLYRPRRYFERVSVRSKILASIYVGDTTDIFHSTFFSTLYKKKIRKVVTIHDMTDEILRKEFGHRWTPLIIDTKKRVLENADKIIAISESTKKDILNIHPWIPEERIKVIYHGVNKIAGGEIIDLDIINTKYGLSLEGKQYFIYVGKRGGFKNFDILLEWFKCYKHKYSDFHVLCTGEKADGTYPARLAAMGLQKCFIFLDYLPDNELAAAYRNAAGLIYPSKYEGFGLPILEAMDNHCPVICSNRSSLPEVGGSAAIYFDPDSVESLNEAISEILSRDRQEMIKQGLENVKRFSWDNATNELVALYEEII